VLPAETTATVVPINRRTVVPVMANLRPEGVATGSWFSGFATTFPRRVGPCLSGNQLVSWMNLQPPTGGGFSNLAIAGQPLLGAGGRMERWRRSSGVFSCVAITALCE
jgi:hypothetical protein